MRDTLLVKQFSSINFLGRIFLTLGNFSKCNFFEVIVSQVMVLVGKLYLYV